MSKSSVMDSRGNFNYLYVNEGGSVNSDLTPEAEARQMATAILGSILAIRVDGRLDIKIESQKTIDKLAGHYNQYLKLSRKVIAASKEGILHEG